MKLNFAIFLFLVGIFLFRLHVLQPKFKEGDKVRVTGRISQDPLQIEGRQKTVIDEISIYAPLFPEYEYSEKIQASGEIAKGKAGFYLKNPQISRLDKQLLISNPRERILALYKKFLPEPHSGLLSGIVLGTKSGLDFKFLEGLNKTGTQHIVVASGTNIVLLAGTTLEILALYIGRRKALIPALAVTWLYVPLSGGQPPIIRAAVMGSIAFLSLALGREASALRALLISASLMLFVKPTWLFDLGFQLSFAATAGLILIPRIISKLFSYLPKVVSENLITTLSAQIAVSPILLVTFGKIPLISPLVNFLVFWTIPWIMLGGVVVAALGLIFEPLGQTAAWFVWLPLEYFVRVVEIFSYGKSL